MDNQVNQVKRVCPKCGAQVAPGSAFCTSCGTPLPKEPVAQPQQRAFAFCTNCGSKYPIGSAFCTNCGHKTQGAPIQNAAPVYPPQPTKEEQDKRAYDQAVQLLASNQFDQAMQIFTRLGDYGDSRAKVQECLAAKDNARKEQIYLNAVAVLTFNRATNVDVQRAIGALQSIRDYKDANQKIAELESRLNQIMAAQEVARKEFVYNQAFGAMSNPASTDVQIQEAIAAFKSLAGFRDAAQKVGEAEACLQAWYKRKAEAEEAERIRKIQAKKRRKSILIAAIIAFVITAIAVAGIVVGNIPHNIEYDLDGGYLTEANPTTYNMFDQITLNNPTKTGYDFLGWTENGAGSPNPSLTINLFNFGDKKFVANWTEHVYTLNLDANGGQLPEGADGAPTVPYKSEFELPEPTREGFKFDGWYNGSSKVTSGIWMFTEDITLVAKWIPIYSVSFEVNGGVLDAPFMDIVYGTEYVLPTPTRTGYTFDGWYLGNERIYDGVWNYEENLVLSAKWTANSYTVYFDKNGGTLSSSYITVTYDRSYSLPTPSKTGYTFAGWYYNGAKIESGVWQKTQDITIEAHWTANKYTVSFNANGGSMSDSNSMVVTYGSYATLPTPTRTGYTFNGWYNGSTRYTSSTWSTASNVSLTAQWTANTYNVYLNDTKAQTNVVVTFDYNYSGAASDYTVTVYNDSTLSYPSMPTRSGYVFTGWYLDEACTTKYNFSGTITNDMTVYAGWREMSRSYVYSETQINPANYTSSSYALSVSTYGTSSSYQKHNYLVANESGYHYIYYKNSYSSSSYRFYMTIYNVTQGTTITSGTVSSTSYYSAYWYCNAGDVIDIAVYQYSSYSSTAYFYFSGFNSVTSSAKASATGLSYADGYTVTQKATYGSTYTLPTLTREGYRFLGWYDTDGTKYEGGTWNTVSNVGLTPAWEEITYYDVTLNNTTNAPSSVTVTFDYNYSGYSDSTVELSNGETLSYPSIPTRTNYIFAGWYTDSDCTTLYDFSGSITEDMTLYAKWIYNSGYNTITVGSSISSIYLSGTTVRYYAFVPLVSGTITVYSSSSYDTYGYLYNSSLGQLTSNDDGGTNGNFRYTYSVTSGTLYYIGIRAYSSGTYGYASLYVTGTQRPTSTATANVSDTTGSYAYSSGDSVTLSLGYGETYTLPTLTRSGYVFDGWYYGTTKIPTTGTWNIQGDVALTPQWR